MEAMLCQISEHTSTLERITMLGIIHALRAALKPSRPPLRISAGIGRPTIGFVQSVTEDGDGIHVTAVLTGEGSRLLLPPIPNAHYSVRALSRDRAEFYPSPGEVPQAITDGIRRASIEDELHAADPRPDLERARALAEYSQTARPGHDEHEFAWRAYVASGSGDLTPWQAFQAGLRAAVERLES